MSMTPSPTSTPPPTAHPPATTAPSVSFQNTSDENPEAADRVTRPSISFTGAGATKDGRRSSIQFAPCADTVRRASRPLNPALKLQRRMSSPPPQSYVRISCSFHSSRSPVSSIAISLISLFFAKGECIYEFPMSC